MSTKSSKPIHTTPFAINGEVIPPGFRQRIELPVARLPTETWLSLPLEVVHGRKPGTTLWLSAAVHGDELNGVEIIRQVLDRVDPQQLKGTLIAAPIVNVFGFIEQSRYLPDRRDLNRSFPGSKGGSLAGRLAHLFMTEVVNRSEYGIDLHTGSNHRSNLPQIRANLRDAETNRCAAAFMPDVMLHSETRDGSLREAATERGKHVLLYEAGEPLRFDDYAIRRGVDGVLRVMAALKMRSSKPKRPKQDTYRSFKTTWIRARRGGMMRLLADLGDFVKAKQEVAVVADAFGSNPKAITAPFDGLVIGQTNNPLVQQGDAVIHLAQVERQIRPQE